MPQKSPLSIVNETFGAKDKLVDKLVGLLDRGDESKDDLRKRLLVAPNSKLLNLHRVATTVKEKFGSRDKLVAETASLLGRSKDKSFVGALEGYTDARLLDMVSVAERRARAAKAKASAAAEPRAAKA
jgi:hypothetical protein